MTFCFQIFIGVNKNKFWYRVWHYVYSFKKFLPSSLSCYDLMKLHKPLLSIRLLTPPHLVQVATLKVPNLFHLDFCLANSIISASAQAVTSKWHFRTTSPINTASPAGENWFSAKMGRSGAVFSSIRMIPRGQTTEISVRTQPSIRFFPLHARNGPFRPFFGPQGAEMEHTLLDDHPEGATGRPSWVHPGYPFPI